MVLRLDGLEGRLVLRLDGLDGQSKTFCHK